METLACFYETYANPKITFGSNFEQNVGWRAVLVKQIDLFCFQAVKNYANP